MPFRHGHVCDLGLILLCRISFYLQTFFFTTPFLLAWFFCSTLEWAPLRSIIIFHFVQYFTLAIIFVIVFVNWDLVPWIMSTLDLNLSLLIISALDLINCIRTVSWFVFDHWMSLINRCFYSLMVLLIDGSNDRWFY